MPLTFTDSPLYYKDSQGNYQRILSGADMTGYRTAAAQDVIDAGKEASGLGLTGASVGDLVRVNSVDSSGKPTSWKKVALNEIKCNKNYLINHYMVGGGSQLGNGAFPINQRGQTAYSNNGYGLDMWYSLGPKNITASGTEFDVTHAANSNNLLQQPINPDFFVGKTISLSALFSDNTLIYLENIVFNGSDVRSADGSFVGFVIGIYVNSYPQSSQSVFRVWATQRNENVTLIDCKLELGPEQTLCHNEGTEENPVWVLNEIPDYGEELAKCQRYLYRYNCPLTHFSSTNKYLRIPIVHDFVSVPSSIVESQNISWYRIDGVQTNLSNYTMEINDPTANSFTIQIAPTPEPGSSGNNKLGYVSRLNVLVSAEP